MLSAENDEQHERSCVDIECGSTCTVHLGHVPVQYIATTAGVTSIVYRFYANKDFSRRIPTTSLVEYMERAGVCDARQTLSKLNIVDLNDDMQDAVLISRALALELTEAATSSTKLPGAIIAWLLVNHEMQYLRYARIGKRLQVTKILCRTSEAEARTASEHYKHELQTTVERHQSLIDEIDANATQSEKSAAVRIGYVPFLHALIDPSLWG